MSVLLIDVGNTRLKWAVSRSGRLSPVTRDCYPKEGGLHDFLAQQWGDIPSPTRVLAVSVAGQGLTDSIAAWAQQAWGVDVEWITSAPHAFGVRNAYLDPARLGADRWVALLAARQLIGGAVCVFDCGTAITFDALAADGQHLGGLISAGIAGMRQCLLQGTAGIELHAETAALTPFARDTSAGVMAGTYYAAVGFIEHMLKEVQKHIEGPIKLVLTGGDAEALAPLINMEFQHEPDLVIKGLNLIARGER